MSDLVKKDVRYLNKDFAQFRQNLINFAKNYYPNTYKDFNESSPGMMFMEMASYVGDVLAYYTDQSFRESLMISAQEEPNILQLSNMLGYKPRLNTPANVKIDIYQLVPAIGTGNDAAPDYRYALTVDANMEVSAENGSSFRTLESVDFNENTLQSPLDISVYNMDSSGNVQYYLFKKQVSAISGQILSREYVFNDPKPYDKITLDETNVMDIVDVIDTFGNTWYQTDYLAQDTVFEDVANIPFNDPQLSQFRSTVPYILKLKRTARRFVTRVRGDYRTELQFGAGISSDADEEIIPNPKNVGLGLEYLKRTVTSNIDPTNFLYTSTYGLAPQNLSLTVRYTVGGGINDNVSANSIVTINNVTYLNEGSVDPGIDLQSTKDSLAVNNPDPASGGLSRDSVENIRQNAIANFGAQSRAITREDYIARVYSMPPKFGGVAKAYIIGDQQVDTSDIDYPSDTISNPLALNLYVLGFDSEKNLIGPNEALKENIRTYLSNFRMLTDAINIKSAYVVNIAIDFEVVPRPNKNSHEVILQCIARLKQLLHVDRMQINGPINRNELVTELDKLEGVQSIPTLVIKNKAGGTYSTNAYDIEAATRYGIIYPSLDPCIFEVKYPDSDIQGKAVNP